MSETRGDLWLIRHGETEWTLTGAHTGRTNLPLTENGKQQGLAVREQLGGRSFAVVLVSPLERALETCRLAGYGGQAVVDPNLAEWSYGSYEGRTSAQIQAERPNWTIWDQGPLDGETIDQVAARAEAVIARVLAVDGDVALFAHGHVLRILTARWLEMPPDAARRFALETGSVSVLGYERDTRVIARWNLR
ncbi:MAG: histidine phosphatase family protein [Bryobacteraceae bacterium]|jgi:probable phosphoglycerate mutase